MSGDLHPSAHPDQTGLDGPATGGGGSWPSKNNPSAPRSGAGSVDMADCPTKRAYWWRRKNGLVDRFLDSYSDRAIRPISVNTGTKLRDDAASERSDGDGFRSKPWHAVLREFLDWYNSYRFAHMRFRNPEGELVRAPMLNSHQPKYGDRYYARLKALERQVLDRFENPHVVMLTLTASNRNSRGGWRCPADHLRDVVDPFGDHVRPALHRALGSNGADVARWEYAKVLEHHKSGYGHMHVAVFVDGEITEADFHAAIDAHLKHCEPAGPGAHNYHADTLEERPISVRAVDDDLDHNAYEAEGPVGNLGSYIAEYIGAHGSELFDRDMSELAFRAASWATGTQRVTFSPGANDLIDDDRETTAAEKLDDDPSFGWAPGTTADNLEHAAKDPDREVSEYLESEQGWTLDGVGVVDEHGEDRHNIDHASVRYVEVTGSPEADPPASLSDLPPLPNLVG